MSYDEVRDREQLRHLDPAIAAFILRARPNAAVGRRRTAILLPGGMGCTLLRAREPYRDDAGLEQSFNYDTIWLNCSTLLGNALKMAMRKQDGRFRDLDDRIVISGGPVKLFGCTPYDGFNDWCEVNGLNWFVLGWDWRRRIEDVADFFVCQFLPYFQQAVTAKGLPDPLADFAVLGHSFGGMVLNRVNRRDDPILGGMRQAITVGTPFYGYGGQVHRWFKGEPFFNRLGQLKVMETIASWPGMYALEFLDADTFKDNAEALAGDADFPLDKYPSKDPTSEAEVDPYNPTAEDSGHHYPTDTGFDVDELAHARALLATLVEPMPAHTTDRFFCVRGVRHVLDTAGAITWDKITENYDPTKSPSPITDLQKVAGDDTQPAWTARLVTQKPEQIKTVQIDLEHILMMNDPAVLDAIGGIMGIPKPALVAAKRRLSLASLRLPPASDPAEALDFVQELQAQRSGLGMLDERTAEAHLGQFPFDKLRAVARRVFQDILKRPP